MKTIAYAVGLFLGIVAAVNPTFAQKLTLAELNQRIAKATSDTALVNLGVQKAIVLFEINLDSAISLTTRTVTLAQRIRYSLGEANAQLQLAKLYTFKGNYDKARVALRRVEEILSASPSMSVLASYNYYYATYYALQEKHDSAFIYFKKAIPLAERLKDEDLLFRTFNNLALTYQRNANFQLALFYFQRSPKLKEVRDNPKKQSTTLLNMGLVYIAINDTLRAERAMFDALRPVKNSGLRIELYNYVTLTALYDFKQDHARLYQYAMKAATMCRQHGGLATFD